MKNQENQKQIEQQYAQQQNFFFETISQKLKYYKENIDTTKLILESIESDHALNDDQFQLLGAFCYLVGIDYTNQQYLTEKVCENVSKRFAIYGFDDETLNLFEIALSKITEAQIAPAKDSLKNNILKTIFVKTEDKLRYNAIRINVKKVINNSLIPVNMAIATNEITTKLNYTYDDIIKINSLINRQCKYVGSKAVKNVLRLYGDDLWSNYLQKALKYFDDQKFAIVYFDGILSVKESKEKFPGFLCDVITGKYKDKTESYNFDEIKASYDLEVDAKAKEKENNPIEEKFKENTYERVPDELMADISANQPLLFVWHVCSDINQYPTKTPQDVFKAIEKLFAEDDYVQHIYHYMKANLSKVKVDDKFGDLNIGELIFQFTEKLEKNQLNYKNSIEIICKEIPEDILKKIVSLIHICIGDLILVTDEEKQYLLSEVMESGITTYQHLAQLLGIIEKCDIQGEQLISYVLLNKYLEDTSEIVEVFKESEGTQTTELEISVTKCFLDFFKATIKAEPTTEPIKPIQ